MKLKLILVVLIMYSNIYANKIRVVWMFVANKLYNNINYINVNEFTNCTNDRPRDACLIDFKDIAKIKQGYYINDKILKISFKLQCQIHAEVITEPTDDDGITRINYRYEWVGFYKSVFVDTEKNQNILIGCKIGEPIAIVV